MEIMLTGKTNYLQAVFFPYFKKRNYYILCVCPSQCLLFNPGYTQYNADAFLMNCIMLHSVKLATLMTNNVDGKKKKISLASVKCFL